jgi:NAD(P)-dependent dehydrogenase (short-subunit alcohol dehydrogenase family)
MAGINANGSLRDKAALVTGASRGIGAAIAARLAMEGARVVVTARTEHEGESRLPGTLAGTVESIRQAGGTAHAIKADLALAADRERLVREATEAVGPIDILVNDAAVTFFAPIAGFSEKRFKLMMEVQVWAPMHLAQLVLPSMKDRGRGWIVNISSGAGIHPRPPYRGAHGGTVYGMCKAALERFTTGLAGEVQADGVAVHGLITEANKDRVQPIKYIAEATYRLASGDPQTLTGQIAYAEPFLKGLAIEPAELIAGF